jgi:hypothetical protein
MLGRVGVILQFKKVFCFHLALSAPLTQCSWCRLPTIPAVSLMLVVPLAGGSILGGKTSSQI